MTIKDRISARLKKLLEYNSVLERFSDITIEELKNDDKRSIIERNLHLACEVVIDVANLLNSEFRLPPEESSKGSIISLGKAKVLDPEFANKLSDLAPFRNVLVHDYLEIDYNIVVDVMNNKLNDFRLFAKKIAEFLQTSPTN
ncbi:MAG: DUF86 domain-containing protein [Patescibacteria group bacterium]